MARVRIDDTEVVDIAHTGVGGVGGAGVDAADGLVMTVQIDRANDVGVADADDQVGG